MNKFTTSILSLALLPAFAFAANPHSTTMPGDDTITITNHQRFPAKPGNH